MVLEFLPYIFPVEAVDSTFTARLSSIPHRVFLNSGNPRGGWVDTNTAGGAGFMGTGASCLTVITSSLERSVVWLACRFTIGLTPAYCSLGTRRRSERNEELELCAGC